MEPSASASWFWREATWDRLAQLIAEHAGLHFPPSRRGDLLRGLEAAAREMDFQDPAQYAEWLLSTPTPSHLQKLACHLTVGETYFFREAATLDALARHVLPQLIAQRRECGRHLRLWSAACSTGEEAYSLAILLDQLLPDIDDWRITLLATDINERALAKANEGVYGEWSFRSLAAEVRERYFTAATSRRFAIRPEIAARVGFAQLNLASPGAPTDVDTRAMDVILCRNVLLYFTPHQAHKLARRLHESLADGGWLAVSPSECSQALFSHFAVVNFPDAILYQKRESLAAGDSDEHAASPPNLSAKRPQAPTKAEPSTPLNEPSAPTKSLPAAESNEIAASPPNPSARRPQAPATAECSPRSNDTTKGRETESSFALLARSFADQGRLSEALIWSEQWIASNKVDASAHYLHATVLQELGHRDGARRALQRCLFLRPDFALAHFALGNLERSDSRHTQAMRHFKAAQRLLQSCPADELLPESEGLTVKHLASIISTLLMAPNP